MTLGDSDIDTLENYLFAKEHADTALDYFGLHGLITASVVGPNTIDINSLWSIALGSDPESKTSVPDEVNPIINQLQNAIRNSLTKEEGIDLPESEEDQEEAITNWCTGFIEGHLHNEQDWFKPDEDVIAELLLPIISLSDFYDELEMEELHGNDKLMASMVDQVPEVITDMYLLYHSK